MRSYETIIMEKHAGWMQGILNKLTTSKPSQWYNKTKASPAFKIKKRIGQGLIGLTGAGYAVDKITKPPEPIS